MREEGTTVYSGSDEVYLGPGGRALQVVVLLNTPSPQIKRPAVCNHRQRTGRLVREIGDYWWEENGIDIGDELRVGLVVRTRPPRARREEPYDDSQRLYLGGRGDNFALTFPEMFENYAHELEKSGTRIRRVVAGFDGDIHERNTQEIRRIRVNGWKVRSIACYKGDPKIVPEKKPSSETMKAIELVRDADTTAHYLKERFFQKPINELLEDRRLTYIWFGERKFLVSSVFGRTNLKEDINAESLVDRVLTLAA